jgi:hypothetical protein
VSWRDFNASSYGTSIVGTVSGTSISFGSSVVFASVNASSISSTYDENAQKIVLSYRDATNSNVGKAIVGTISGTSVSFGTPVVYDTTFVADNDIVYDAGASKIVIAYRDVTNTQGKVITGSVSGTSISFDAPLVFEDTEPREVATTYDANSGKVVIAYWDGGNSDYGTAAVFQAPFTNLTATNYIGIADSDAADTGKAAINTRGAVDDNQTGLTAGQAYYVQTDGTLSTTAGDPSVFAGTAVSATKLIVKG